MAKISVDGVEYEVDPGNNLLQECLSQGLDLPYFCWHPCMGSVGACRQCAVKQYRDAQDETGTIVMACMTPASDGSIISIKDPQAVDFRSHVIESLMINHPHDCPVCEEGGECHLQDMTQMSGHNYRRYDFKKRTHRNQNLGPFINHEMNRCIACYRCVRFYNDYAGGSDLAALGAHHHVYFGRHEEGTLENEFSGNLVEVCPTGVFTDKTFSAHYTRKWDLQTAPSICTGCGVGCNTTPGERYGTLRRVVNRYHHDINGYFICDRGRFGYGANNSERRVRQAQYCNHGDTVAMPLTALEADRQFVAMTGGDVIGIASPRASLESNIALRNRVGANNFYVGVSDAQLASLRQVLSSLRDPSVYCPDLRSLEQSDCVLIVNEDITNTSARMALAVRQATRNAAAQLAGDARIPLWQDAAVRDLAQDSRSPLVIVSPQGTRLDDVASDMVLMGLSEQLVLLECLVGVLDEEHAVPSQASAATLDIAKRIAKTLRGARRPSIISGVTAESPELVQACSNVARALQRARQVVDSGAARVGLCFAMPEANSMGLALMLDGQNGTLSEALARIRDGSVDAVIVLENDLYRRAEKAAVDTALATATPFVVIDQLHNAFNAQANLLLPCASAAEQNGTWVNYEGRAQSSYQVFESDAALRASCEWLTQYDPVHASSVLNTQILLDFARAHEEFAKLAHLLLVREGIAATMKSPRQLHRYSGRTAMLANVQVHEPKQAQDHKTALAFSMEGVLLQKDASLMSAAWAPAWNSNQAIGKFQEEINGELKQGCKGVHLSRRSNASADYERVQLPAARPALECFTISHLFGGEEITANASAIQARALGSYACIGQELAESLGVRQHGTLTLKATAYTVQLPVLIRARIAANCIGVYNAGELDTQALFCELTVQAVAEDSNVLARSRVMFDQLPINDALEGEG